MTLDNDLLWIRKIISSCDNMSEDLDFTLLNNEISNEQIFEWFNEIFDLIKEEANKKCVS